jgi:hypothetical protein
MKIKSTVAPSNLQLADEIHQHCSLTCLSISPPKCKNYKRDCLKEWLMAHPIDIITQLCLITRDSKSKQNGKTSGTAQPTGIDCIMLLLIQKSKLTARNGSCREQG